MSSLFFLVIAAVIFIIFNKFISSKFAAQEQDFKEENEPIDDSDDDTEYALDPLENYSMLGEGATNSSAIASYQMVDEDMSKSTLAIAQEGGIRASETPGDTVQASSENEDNQIEFSLRDAVIYSEIMRPKWKE